MDRITRYNRVMLKLILALFLTGTLLAGIGIIGGIGYLIYKDIYPTKKDLWSIGGSVPNTEKDFWDGIRSVPTK